MLTRFLRQHNLPIAVYGSLPVGDRLDAMLPQSANRRCNQSVASWDQASGDQNPCPCHEVDCRLRARREAVCAQVGLDPLVGGFYCFIRFFSRKIASTQSAFSTVKPMLTHWLLRMAKNILSRRGRFTSCGYQVFSVPVPWILHFPFQSVGILTSIRSISARRTTFGFPLGK